MIVLIAIVALSLGGIAVAAATWGLMIPHARAAARLREIDVYGYGAAGPGPAVVFGPAARRESLLLDIATRVGKIVANRFGTRYTEHVRGKLIAAGLYRAEPHAVVGVQLLGAGTLGGLSALTGVGGDPGTTLFVSVFAAALALAFPYVAIHGRAHRRLDTIDRALPDLIDMIVVTMEAGLGFGASLDAASTRMRGPIGEEIRLTIQEHRMGLALTEALLHMLRRVDTPNISSFVRAVTQGEKLGVSMGLIMRNLAEEMRLRRRQKAEEQAHKAPVKMLFPLIFLMFPALFVVILGPAFIEITDTLSGLTK